MVSPHERENPYASPTTEHTRPEDQQPLIEQQLFEFSGAVDRGTLRSSLRPRLSWPGLATLGVGAFICVVAAPPEFLNPLVRSREAQNDLLGELVGLAGVGLFGLAMWHIVCASTFFTVARAESTLLRQQPSLYRQQASGWLRDDCLFLRDQQSQSWTSWQALNYFEQGGYSLMLNWGGGLSSTTVLTSNMFADDEAFARACTLVQKLAGNNRTLRSYADLPDYFLTSEVEGCLPEESEIIGIAEQRLACRHAWWSIARQIWSGILANSIPLHVFFGFLMLCAAALMANAIAGMMVVAGCWLGIIILGTAIAMGQHISLLRMGDRRLACTKTIFTQSHVLIHMTTGFYRLPIAQVKMLEEDESQFSIAPRYAHDVASKSTHRSTLQRTDFRSEADWMSVRGRLRGGES